jgi:TatD DNase family protein
VIDIGANLVNAAFREDVDAVIERAHDAGVRHIVVTGTDLDSSRRALALCRRHPHMLGATAGVHPHDAKDASSDTLTGIRDLLACPEIVAAGETGLDFNRDYSPRPTQEQMFEQQLEIAAEANKPVFVHERDTGRRLADILARHRARLGDVVIHCFTGNAAMLERYLEMDCHIGITGWVCDERRGMELQSLVPRIPAERLMIETDAPFLLPRTLEPRPKGRRNEPAFLVWVARKIAELRGEPVEDVARYTEANARRFFGIAS